MSANLAHIHQPVAKYIYNHGFMNCTAGEVDDNHLYSGRALGLTEPWDMIQLHEDLRPLWKDITAHYDRIGLTYTNDVTWYLNLKELGAHIGYQPSVYYFGPEEYGNWGDIHWYECVEYINSKNNFIHLAKELGVDIPQTLCFDCVSEINEYVIQGIRFPCYLKAAISVTGLDIYRCEDKSELIENQFKFSFDSPVQIQEEIKTETFLNLQYMVSNDEVIRLATSEQILDSFVHQGNRVPAGYEPWSEVDKMALWLRDHGMKGLFAFKVAAVKTEHGMRFPVIECHPGFNDDAYPALIAQKLDITQWSTITFSTQYRSLNEIDLSDVEYDIKTGEGLVIINWGTILSGKLMFLIAGSEEYQEALKLELEARLC